MVFRHARHSSVARKHPDHCIVGQIQDGRHLFKVKPLIYIIWTELKQILDFGIYRKVFRYDAVVRPECTLDIALWAKSNMAAICSKSNL